LRAARSPEVAVGALPATALGFWKGPDTLVDWPESAVDDARRAWSRLDYRTALEVLDRALRRSPESPVLLSAYASVYLRAEEPARARQYLDKAIRLNPDCRAAALGEAEALLLDHDYSGAESWLKQLLSKGPGTSEIASNAHSLLARALLEMGQQNPAEIEAGKALDADAKNSNALYVMAFIKAAERKPGLVRSLARRAVDLDPYMAGARRLLSQYLNGSAGYQQKVGSLALQHFQRGKSLQASGNLDGAAVEFEAAVGAEPDFYRALIALAGLRLGQRDYQRATSAASRAIGVDSEGAVANMELAYAQIGLAEQARIEIGATDYTARFFEQPPAPVKVSLLRLIFPDYDKLDEGGRFVLGKSVAGLACYLPGLASANARHYLLPLDQSIGESSGFQELRDRTTFDGRYYASIRGIGGRIALSGVESLDEAARGGFNVIAHEFAHQVHETAMGPEEHGAIHRLYEAARREGRALDFYAAANEFEYFAVGYEAFVSSFKRPGTGLTARHTRDELKSRDPELFSLLTRLSDRSVRFGMD
jgi:tetratricopeptide (TPR) repeat protein